MVIRKTPFVTNRRRTEHAVEISREFASEISRECRRTEQAILL